MRRLWKDRRFWVCVLLFVVLFYLLAGVFGNHDLRGPVSVTYLIYTYVPVALTVGSWLLGLYQLWTGRWGRGDLRGWGFLVLICGSSAVPSCFYSNGACACLGVSLVLGIGAILLGRE